MRPHTLLRGERTKWNKMRVELPVVCVLLLVSIAAAAPPLNEASGAASSKDADVTPCSKEVPNCSY